MPPPSLPSASALHLRGSQLSPAQRRFNSLLARVETLTQRLHDTQSAADAHRRASATTLGALQAQHAALTRRLALYLDERLQHRATLTTTEQRTAAALICQLSAPMAAGGDTAMRALHDRHSPRSLRAHEQDELAELQAQVEAWLGEPLDKTEVRNREALLHAARLRLQEQAAHKQAQRKARAAKRPKPAHRQQAGGAPPEAHGALRTVFRQLASALHPDREPDAAERARKTALMSRANTAYERQDLAALLQLQLQLEQTHPDTLARLADDRINAMASLLQQQVGTLEQTLRSLEQQLRHEFDLSPRAAVDAEQLEAHRQQARQALEHQTQRLEQDLQRIQDMEELRRWLKERTATK